jgi:chemotaxis protein MotB
VAARLDHQGRPGRHRRILQDAAEGGHARRLRQRRQLVDPAGRRQGPDRRNGQVKKGDTRPDKKTYDLKAAKAAWNEEAQRLKALKAKIEATIEANPLLKKYKNQLLLDITSEGLRIQIVDEQNRPMFALAKAELQPYTRDILHVMAWC